MRLFQDLLVLIFSLLLLPARIKAKIGAKRSARRIYRLGLSYTDGSFFNRYMDILEREIERTSPKIECWYDFFKVVLAENRKSIDEWENFYDRILNLTIYLEVAGI